MFKVPEDVSEHVSKFKAAQFPLNTLTWANLLVCVVNEIIEFTLLALNKYQTSFPEFGLGHCGLLGTLVKSSLAPFTVPELQAVDPLKTNSVADWHMSFAGCAFASIAPSNTKRNNMYEWNFMVLQM
jgi:hypothetical protein